MAVFHPIRSLRADEPIGFDLALRPHGMGHIAFVVAVVAATIGGFGPRTRGLALEAIAH